jgi:imidazoleglycerol-phosphate dehydratase
MRSFADNAKATIHIRVLRGTDRHHIVEGAFKALGYAIRDSLESDGNTVNSTKGEAQIRSGDAD